MLQNYILTEEFFVIFARHIIIMPDFLRDAVLHILFTLHWLCVVTVNALASINTVIDIGLDYYLDWRLSAGRYTISVCNQPHRSTQPSIPPWLRVR